MEEQTPTKVLVDYYREEVDPAVRRARDSIARARAELDTIENELNKAQRGEGYLRIGEIRGVDAGLVFVAFGAIENAAITERLAAREVSSG
jgi:hypothetical protein